MLGRKSHCDFQNKGKSGWTGTSFFVLEVPLRHSRPCIIYSLPCDRILQRAYCYRLPKVIDNDIDSSIDYYPLLWGIIFSFTSYTNKCWTKFVRNGLIVSV